MPVVLSSAFAILVYVAAAVLLAIAIARPPGPPRALAPLLAWLAATVHAVLLFGMHRNGVDLHFFAALSLCGFGIALTTLVVNLTRPVAGLGVIVFPLAALLLAIDTFLAPATNPQQLEWQINLHAAFALLGYSLLSIAAVLAILLALQERALRQRRLDSGLIRALPPLTLTEALMFRLIAAGFVLLTLTLLSGVLFVDDLFAQHLVHKTTLSIISWVVFGLLLFGRWRWGWRGRRAVRLTLAGMAILLLAFFGTKFVLELLLARKA
ncbi:MAG TPA: cytochrome c biogenesis protein CcsA [Dokdonella sp.]|uniref:cytochrome C assembly family protein n=1 Tax=Dokdonella sp. TaxID=2291710 RepID=UPI0025C5A8BF|nr:cytochrome c biogenesis protein CcsA [Dokdonella sp.]MBX3693404.1 cytochrome c biogenesis protein CcsA [Dokdonella sp.]HNR91551.1 cytochrome c biogenesis protein CcsA [Dokdonella sp.]